MCIRDRYQRRVHGEPIKDDEKKIEDNQMESKTEIEGDKLGDKTEEKKSLDEDLAKHKEDDKKPIEEDQAKSEKVNEKRIGSVKVEQNKDLKNNVDNNKEDTTCLLYTSPSPRDLSTSRMPSSA
eukprot:TRINITY_DN3011_c0_g1_i10.p2 TRINITY_DN3011_c0_g1~~TRINITY_DN3011_c0_g1_i10.p2  ORF type:complete len:124 (+),score=53.60 TRINITY_DN3011_c0_g1_i10:77-448(+)